MSVEPAEPIAAGAVDPAQCLVHAGDEWMTVLLDKQLLDRLRRTSA